MSQPEALKILVVDDEPSIRSLLRRWIERNLAAEIVEAEDGLQAIEAITAGSIDIVVLDVNMPILDGIGMLRLLRGDPKRDRLDIIVASYVAAEEKIREVIELGVSDYLLKPLKYEAVMARLKSAAARAAERRKRLSEETESVKPRLLIADNDEHFGDVAKSALSDHYNIRQVDAVGQLLVQILRWTPPLVIVSSRIPGLDLSELIGRVGALPGAVRPRFIYLAEVDSADAPAGLEDAGEIFIGTLQRSFVEATLRADLARLAGSADGGGGLEQWREFLEAELTTALFQALGMMTGAEPQLTQAEAPAFEPEMFGRIHVRSERGDFQFVIQIDTTTAFTKALKREMAKSKEEPEEKEPCIDTFNEILNVVGGRIKNFCLDRRIKVETGDPEATNERPTPAAGAVFDFTKEYVWTDGLPLRVGLHAEYTEPVTGSEDGD